MVGTNSYSMVGRPNKNQADSVPLFLIRCVTVLPGTIGYRLTPLDTNEKNIHFAIDIYIILRYNKSVKDKR